MSNNLINIFKQLVSIDSPSGEEKKIANYIYKFLLPKVDDVKIDKYGNVYARINGNKDSIFLSAHMDTVEPGRNIKPKIINGYIVSDGKTILGADNKLAIASILTIIKYLKNSNHKTIEFIFTRSEEVGNYGAINFDYSLLKSKLGYCFDVASPIGTVVTASPFYERFDLEIIGKEAHASKPDIAINVLPILNTLLNNIHLGKIDKDTLFNIGVINSGRVRNTIPGRINIKGEIRSFKEKNLINYKNVFLQQLENIINKYKAKYSIEFVRENPGYKFFNNDMSKIYTYLKNIFTELNIKPKFIENWGVSDANIFNEKELLCINLGDGSEFPHTTNERVNIKEINNLVKLMLKLIKI